MRQQKRKRSVPEKCDASISAGKHSATHHEFRSLSSTTSCRLFTYLLRSLVYLRFSEFIRQSSVAKHCLHFFGLCVHVTLRSIICRQGVFRAACSASLKRCSGLFVPTLWLPYPVAWFTPVHIVWLWARSRWDSSQHNLHIRMAIFTRTYRRSWGDAPCEAQVS